MPTVDAVTDRQQDKNIDIQHILIGKIGESVKHNVHL
jgi:hypothetical protein